MRSESRADSRMFRELMRSLLDSVISVRFRAHGHSMHPAIADGETVQVDPLASAKRGDVVIVDTADGFRAHRVRAAGATQGDCCIDADPESRPLGTVFVATDEGTSVVPRRRPGTVVRSWLARWRGRF